MKQKFLLFLRHILIPQGFVLVREGEVLELRLRIERQEREIRHLAVRSTHSLMRASEESIKRIHEQEKIERLERALTGGDEGKTR